jgi:hypothetical protein
VISIVSNFIFLLVLLFVVLSEIVIQTACVPCEHRNPNARLIRTMRSDTSEGRPATVKVLLRHGLLRVILVFMGCDVGGGSNPSL